MKINGAPVGASQAEPSAKEALALAEQVVRRYAPRFRDLDHGDAMSAAHEALVHALREHDPKRGTMRAFIVMRVRAAVRDVWRRPRDPGHRGGGELREQPSDRVHGLDSSEAIDISAAHRVVERALHAAALESQAALERRLLIEDMRRLVGDDVLALLLSEAPERVQALAAGIPRNTLVRRLKEAREAIAEAFAKKVQVRGPRRGSSRL